MGGSEMPEPSEIILSLMRDKPSVGKKLLKIGIAILKAA
jgi:hypothetical protein